MRLCQQQGPPAWPRPPRPLLGQARGYEVRRWAGGQAGASWYTAGARRLTHAAPPTCTQLSATKLSVQLATSNSHQRALCSRFGSKVRVKIPRFGRWWTNHKHFSRETSAASYNILSLCVSQNFVSLSTTSFSKFFFDDHLPQCPPHTKTDTKFV